MSQKKGSWTSEQKECLEFTWTLSSLHSQRNSVSPISAICARSGRMIPRTTSVPWRLRRPRLCWTGPSGPTQASGASAPSWTVTPRGGSRWGLRTAEAKLAKPRPPSLLPASPHSLNEMPPPLIPCHHLIPSISHSQSCDLLLSNTWMCRPNCGSEPVWVWVSLVPLFIQYYVMSFNTISDILTLFHFYKLTHYYHCAVWKRQGFNTPVQCLHI